jgi:hypothetical protein
MIPHSQPDEEWLKKILVTVLAGGCEHEGKRAAIVPAALLLQ